MATSTRLGLKAKKQESGQYAVAFVRDGKTLLMHEKATGKVLTYRRAEAIHKARLFDLVMDDDLERSGVYFA